MDMTDRKAVISEHPRDQHGAMTVQRLTLGTHYGNSLALRTFGQAFNAIDKTGCPRETAILYPPVDVAGHVICARAQFFTQKDIFKASLM